MMIILTAAAMFALHAPVHAENDAFFWNEDQTLHLPPRTETAKVTVRKPTLKLSKSTLTMKAGKTARLKASSNCGNATFRWSSSNKYVATVSAKGKVKAKHPGTAVIKVTAYGITRCCKVRVKAKTGTQIAGDSFTSRDDQESGTTPAGADNTTSVRARLEAMKKKYPDGMPFGEEKQYKVNNPEAFGFGTGRACAAFAFELSDYLFGNAPGRRYTNPSLVREGDVLRINYDTHFIIVLQVFADGSIDFAEGNCSGRVRWDSHFSADELRRCFTYGCTRY